MNGLQMKRHTNGCAVDIRNGEMVLKTNYIRQDRKDTEK